MIPDLLGRLARLFYRRIETTGLPNVPGSGPVLLVANHANGLVDPMIVLAVLGRPITFVAKSTLWKIPVLNSVLNALGAVPVVRRVDAAQEGAGGERNEASLARLADALDGGRAVLIFPEGRSHSDPELSPIRSGAARVLLLACRELPVVPVGLWFAKKEEFRSDVLARFGAPLAPADRSVAGWTQAIEEGLRDVTLNAESWAEHEAASAVEAVYGARLEEALGAPAAGELERRFRTRRLLLEARRSLAASEPVAVERLSRRARAYRRLCANAGLAAEAGEPRGGVGAVVAASLWSVLRLPFALLGAVALWVPYRLVAVVTKRTVRGGERDQVSLHKLLSGLLLFSATYAVEVAGAWLLLGPRAALAAAFLVPLCGLAALSALDESERDVALLRRRLLAWGGPSLLQRLGRERDALIAECDRLAEVLGRQQPAGADNRAVNVAERKAVPAASAEGEAPVPATPYERAAYAAAVALLLFVFVYHLVPALVAGLLVTTVLSEVARRLHGPRLSHGASKLIALFLIASVAAGITMTLALVVGGLVHGHAGDLPSLFQKMADALDIWRGRLGKLGYDAPFLDSIKDPADVQVAFSGWLREHAQSLRSVGGGFGRFLLHAVMGILAGLLVFFGHGGGSHGPLAAALTERVRRFAEAFRIIVFAQVEISLINTTLTAIYLLGILPLTGHRLPLTGTLLLLTFLAGLLPVVGNLISNTTIVVLSLGVGPWVALGSLVFLIVVHKLEYLVNARIVGSKVNAAAWEVLIAIILFEVAFRVPGVVLAPVVYAWGKRELMDRGLV